VHVTISTPRGSVLDSLVTAGREAEMIVVGVPQTPEHTALPAQLAAMCGCDVVEVGEDGVATAMNGDHAFTG
jgi:hypothetical protein